jgi:uncharacterized protein DUF3309
VDHLHAEVEADSAHRSRNFSAQYALYSWFSGRLRKSAMLGTILIIILILLLIGALPNWGYSSGWGYYPGGGLGIILIIVIILVLMGRI